MPVYTPTAWAAGVTPLSQANLNNLESMIDSTVHELGSHTAEQTTNALAGVDLSTVGGLTIPVDQHVLIVCQYRKTAGAAAQAFIGLKINAVVTYAAVGGPTLAVGNGAEEGYLAVRIGPREANYLGGGNFKAVGTAGGNLDTQATPTADMPAAVITDVTVRGYVGNALITMGTKNLYVFSFGG